MGRWGGGEVSLSSSEGAAGTAAPAVVVIVVFCPNNGREVSRVCPGAKEGALDDAKMGV